MISISRQIDGHDIAAQVRMERQVHKGAFLLLEGEKDQRRLIQFVDQAHCAVVCCFGKVNVIVAVDQLSDDGFSGILGLIDADFDRILSRVTIHENLIYSNFHDFDIDVVLSPAGSRYLLETSDPRKLATFGSPLNFFTSLINLLKPLAAMRLVNEREGLGYSFKNLRIEDFFDGQNIDVDRMIEAVSTGAFSSQAFKDRLRNKVLNFHRLDFDLRQATNGHDLCAALGVCLRDQLGNRLFPQTLGREVELHFRLTYSREDFEMSPVFVQIETWCQNNPPYKILH